MENGAIASAPPLHVVILAQSDGQRVLVQEMGAGNAAPRIEPIDAFAARWSGQFLLQLFGLVIVFVFESVLSALRAYVFSHTTSRIDVELGARLFRHLVSLPLAYFQARRVGDSVARVRELENIRSFLAGNALSVLLDVFFSIVFVAVMLFYSVPLTLIVLVSLPLYFGLTSCTPPNWPEHTPSSANCPKATIPSWANRAAP